MLQTHLKLAGKAVLITGGAVRIGRQIARSFAHAGAAVAVHCRSSVREADELVRELNQVNNGNCIRLQADLAESASRESLIPAVIEHFDKLDLLINNASVYRRSRMRELSETELREDWQLNFEAPFHLMRQFAETVESGSVINLLDQRVAGVDPGAGAYGLAKKMLRDAGEAAALEWAPRIRVNGVAPGLVLPPPGVSPERMKPLLQQIPMRQASSPEEIAEACLFLAASSTITGQTLYVDGGLHLGRPPVEEKN